MEDFETAGSLSPAAIVWLAVPEVLDRETIALAEEASGWDERRTAPTLSQVLKRARRRQGAEDRLEGRGRTPGTTFERDDNRLFEDP